MFPNFGLVRYFENWQKWDDACDAFFFDIRIKLLFQRRKRTVQNKLFSGLNMWHERFFLTVIPFLVILSVGLPWATGNSVAIQWQSCVPGTWTPVYTGMPLEKELLVASVLPVCFQWPSSGFPVVFRCVPIMQINTGSPLEHHWVLALASVLPVASQRICGSHGLPVWSVQWYPGVLTESGLEVIRSGHFQACDPLCIELVWWELFELNWFHLTCNRKYTKTIMVLIPKACTEWCWSTHTC